MPVAKSRFTLSVAVKVPSGVSSMAPAGGPPTEPKLAVGTAHLRPPCAAVMVLRLALGATVLPRDGFHTGANVPKATYEPDGWPLSGGRVPSEEAGSKPVPVLRLGIDRDGVVAAPVAG